MRVAAEYLSQANKAFIERKLFGSDIYTSDSDAVCILQHSGFFKIKELAPTNIEGVSLFFRVSKGRSTYNSSLKNGIKSKKMNSYQGHSIKLENYTLLKKFGDKNELLGMAEKMPFISEYERKKPAAKKINDNNLYKDFNLVFNLSFEMWMAYSLPAICDKGRDLKDYTSWKLKDKVLYLETKENRYEIARNVSDHTNDDYLFEEFETFRLSKVHPPVGQKDNDFMLGTNIPLGMQHVEVVFARLDWHDFEWGEDSMKVNGIEIKNIKCFNFYNIK